jgi:hypothetical protein
LFKANFHTINKPSLFKDIDTYIHKLSRILKIKSLDDESFIDPYLLYRYHEKDGTNLFFDNKYPYLNSMRNIFAPKPHLSGEDCIRMLRFNSGSNLMSKLELEFKNLNATEFIRAVIAKHNSEYVTLSPVGLHRDDKEKALLKIGHNTPSPENPEVTPLDNTMFKDAFSTEVEEWKAV